MPEQTRDVQRRRATLRVASLTYGGIYLSVVLVALVTGGDALLSESTGWYAALAPLVYAATCALWSMGVPRELSRLLVALLHLATLPALVVSFLGLGLLLPLLAILWWRAAGKPRVFQHSG
jgi:hypothetical protein